MTASRWGARHQATRDAAWMAWRRIGVDPFALAFDKETPDVLAMMAREIARAVVGPTLAVIDAMDVTLDQEARSRVLLDAATKTVSSVAYSIADAIADEVARPGPVPFSPPPAGAWVRVRWLRNGPHWDGMWHVYSGDFKSTDVRSQGITGRALCGARLTLRDVGLFDDGGGQDHVVADDKPGVDACLKCARSLDKASGKRW